MSDIVETGRYFDLGADANPAVGESEEIDAQRRVCSPILDHLGEAFRKIDRDKGLNDRGRREKRRALLREGTMQARQAEYLREDGVRIQKRKEEDARKRSNLTSRDVLLRDLEGGPEQEIKKGEILRHLRGLDELERDVAIRRAIESGDDLTIAALIDDPLRAVAGPVVPQDTQAEILETYSRQKLPDLWAEVDRRAAETSILSHNHEMYREAFERITGHSLDSLSDIEPKPLRTA